MKAIDPRAHLPGIPTLPDHPVGHEHRARGGTLSLVGKLPLGGGDPSGGGAPMSPRDAPKPTRSRRAASGMVVRREVCAFVPKDSDSGARVPLTAASDAIIPSSTIGDRDVSARHCSAMSMSGACLVQIDAGCARVGSGASASRRRGETAGMGARALSHDVARYVAIGLVQPYRDARNANARQRGAEVSS